MPLIRARNLKKEYLSDGLVTPVLYGLDFDIEKGELLAIMGPSGSGKSTLMHILGFLDRPTSGVYEFDGQDTSKFDDHRLAELRNESVGFVFQSFNLLPRTTVLDNVKLPLLYSKKKNHDQLAKAALESVDLSHRLNYFTNQISGGEKQRVAIARALAKSPRLLFADEPTSALDGENGQIVIKLLQRAAKAHGAAVICVTHDPRLEAYADRIIHIEDGRILDDRRTAHGSSAAPQPSLIEA